MHVFRIATAGVLAGEFDIFHQRAGVGHHFGGDFQHFRPAFAQLVLEVDVAGGNEGMDAAPHRRGHGLGAGFDVSLGGPGQTADHRTVRRADSGGDPLHGVEIAAAGKGEAGLNDVDTEAGELLGDRQLFFQVQAGTRRLLAVPQGGVKNKNPAGITRHGNNWAAKRTDYELPPL